MTKNSLCFHPLVAQDLQEAFLWYEEQATGLGQRFYAEVDIRFDHIEEKPDRFAHAFGEPDYRFAMLNKFPYLIIFRTHEGNIEILGVFHSASSPEKWRR